MKLPPLELLKRTHIFPGHYTFKAVGKVDLHFADRLVAAVRDELDLEKDPPVKRRLSGSGQHCSVTLELRVQSAEEVHAIYERIAAVPGILLML